MTMYRATLFPLMLVLIAGCGEAPPPSAAPTAAPTAATPVATTVATAVDTAWDRAPADPFEYAEVTIEGDLEAAPDASPAATPLPVSAPIGDATASTSMRERLQQLGFDLREPSDDEDSSGEDAASLLVHHRRGVWFDVETGMWPNEHDVLAQELADAVAPALDGAIFKETPPDSDDDETPYRLDATLAGRHYSVNAANHGDWYDVDAVVGLLNSMLRDRSDPQRLLVVATEDQTTIVIGGPAPALVAAVGEGLIEVGSATQATALGKAFEEQERRSLQAQ